MEIYEHGRSKALLQGLKSWELESGFGSKVTLVTSEYGLGLYALIHCYFHGTCFFIFWPQLVFFPSSLGYLCDGFCFCNFSYL